MTYVRLDDANHDWLRQQAAATGMSMAALVDALVSDARARGMTFVRPSAIVLRREREDDDAEEG